MLEMPGNFLVIFFKQKKNKSFKMVLKMDQNASPFNVTVHAYLKQKNKTFNGNATFKAYAAVSISN